MATARPVVSVFKAEAPDEIFGTVKAPCVFTCPLRPDLVRFVHTNMAKNKRQAQGVKFEAGHDTAAISWGTGRAVARIPRVPGGGTHRSGQGAFGNMCRGGGMFAPLKVWRKWHRKVNVQQKRHAVATAVAATGLPALVFARGHHIAEVPELPLVVSDGAEKMSKTKQAIELLSGLGCTEELTKVSDSKKLRRGKGKMRNRRYTMRKGPLVIYDNDDGITRAFRNIPGVDVCQVGRLNLLQLAPGGSFGRLVLWTQSAFKKLADLFGSYKGPSVLKKGYRLPRPLLMNADLTRLINSEEVQSVVRPQLEGPAKYSAKKNPLKNKGIAARLFPGLNARKKLRIERRTKGTKLHAAVQAKKKVRVQQAKTRKGASRKFYRDMMAAYEVKAKKEDEE